MQSDDDSFWSNKGTIYSYLFPSTSPTTTNAGSSTNAAAPPGGIASTLEGYWSAVQENGLPALSRVFTVNSDKPLAHTFSIPFPSAPGPARQGVISTGRGKVSAAEVEGFEVRNASFKIETDSPLLSVLVAVMLLHYLYLALMRSTPSQRASTKPPQSPLLPPQAAFPAAPPPQPHDEPTVPPTLNQYYVIQTTETTDSTTSPRRQVYADPHDVWLRNLESSGVLFLGGDLTDTADSRAAVDTSTSTLDGVTDSLETMYIIRAKSLAHATTIASSDPYNENCLRNYRVYPWAVEAGQVSVKIGLAECACRLE
jgi:uncharacterized protein YciI